MYVFFIDVVNFSTYVHNVHLIYLAAVLKKKPPFCCKETKYPEASRQWTRRHFGHLNQWFYVDCHRISVKNGSLADFLIVVFTCVDCDYSTPWLMVAFQMKSIYIKYKMDFQCLLDVFWLDRIRFGETSWTGLDPWSETWTPWIWGW